jgi:hypothetical protein
VGFQPLSFDDRGQLQKVSCCKYNKLYNSVKAQILSRAQGGDLPNLNIVLESASTPVSKVIYVVTFQQRSKKDRDW